MRTSTRLALLLLLTVSGCISSDDIGGDVTDGNLDGDTGTWDEEDEDEEDDDIDEDEDEDDDDTGDSYDTGSPDEDQDDDGYTEDDGDCDDTDATVNPGAQEICEDLVDNDCDGVVDEDTDENGCEPAS